MILLNKKLLRYLFVIFICLFFSINAYSLPKIEPDKYIPIFMEGRGINCCQQYHHYHSKGLNNFVKIEDNIYMVSLDEYDNIVIELINDTKKEEFFNTGIKADNYNNQYRGAGIVCSDGTEHLYITYCFHDGSVNTAKISLKTKTILWTSKYRLTDLKYFPLDGIYYEGYLYLLICENQNSFHIVKIDSSGENTKTPVKISNYKLNALSVCEENICIYGSLPVQHHIYGNLLYMCRAKYDLEGNLVSSKVYTDREWWASITRAFVNGKEEFVLYRDYDINEQKNKITKFGGKWHNNILGDANSIYVEGGNEYVGYANNKASGYHIYDDKGVLQQNRYIIMPEKVKSNNAIYVDKEKIYLLSSLEDGSAVLSFIPYKQKAYVYTNEKEENFKDSVVYPRISLTENGNFTYKIKYVNYLNQPPNSGFPKLYIYKNNLPISNSPFIMNAEDIYDKNYTDGKIYKYDIDLSFAEGDIYSYSIELASESETFLSETYYYPIYGNKPSILSFENEYIFPKSNRYDTTKLEAKIRFLEPNGYDIGQNYPRISIYTNEDIPVIMNVHMQYTGEESGGLKVYACNLGSLNIGEYKYKIEAKNEMGTEADNVEGVFEVIDSVRVGIKSDTIFNVPNPFSPHGKPTKIMFRCDKNETVKIKIYTLYGDLVYEDIYYAKEGANEYEYKGRDGNGKPLYNGAYICQLEKSNGKRLRCKILVIK